MTIETRLSGGHIPDDSTPSPEPPGEGRAFVRLTRMSEKGVQ